MFSEWLYLPEAAAAFLCDPGVWLFLIGGVFLGFVVGVVPGLGPTMGMALCLGLVFHLEYTHGMALLVGIFVASCGSGGITASLINIPGTPAAAATCLDGNALTKQGRGREAVGYSIAASVVGTLVGTILIFLIQPFVTGIALKFSDWETFLFCVFGLLICGSISGGSRRRGWIAALAGCLLSLTGADGVQSVLRFTFGRGELLSGFNSVIAMLGLFGLGEVLYTLCAPEPERTVEKTGFPLINWTVLKANLGNMLRSALAGLWIGHRRVCRLLVFLRSCPALLQAKREVRPRLRGRDHCGGSRQQCLLGRCADPGSVARDPRQFHSGDLSVGYVHHESASRPHASDRVTGHPLWAVPVIADGRSGNGCRLLPVFQADDPHPDHSPKSSDAAGGGAVRNRRLQCHRNTVCPDPAIAFWSAGISDETVSLPDRTVCAGPFGWTHCRHLPATGADAVLRQHFRTNLPSFWVGPDGSACTAVCAEPEK